MSNHREKSLLRKMPHLISDNTSLLSLPLLRSTFFLLLLISAIFLLLHRSPPTTTPSTTSISSPLPTTILTATSTCTSTSTTLSTPTNLSHILFSIASSASSFPCREPYLRLWYNPNSTRALVFLDRLPNLTTTPSAPIPPLLVSADTTRFPYTFPRGHRSAIRLARVLKEAVDRRDPGVRWFVFGDDDTVFFPENLASLLADYDHNDWVYVGGRSESFEQNAKISFDMAYGGGGFAVSYPLARVLARVLDSCLMRYPHLYGSDSRISACVAELGVAFTFEPGFHQVDVRGSLFGLLTSHPLSPLISLHHLEVVDPIFPDMNRTQSLKHLLEAARTDPARILQQSVCYDRSNNLTVSVSWGYAVQVYGGSLLLPDLLLPQRTFTPWRRRSANTQFQYVINTRDYPKNPCERPAVFFLDSVLPSAGKVLSRYSRKSTQECSRGDVFGYLKEIRVSSRRLELYDGKVKSRRRQCCDILRPYEKSMQVDVRACGVEELIAMKL